MSRTPEKNRARYKIYYAENREEISARHKAHYYAHREEERLRHASYYATHRDKKRAYHADHREEIIGRRMFKKYGIPPGTFKAMLQEQGGACAICETTNFNGVGPCIDHDHISGKVRGILCPGCNVTLGNAKDSIPLLKRMIEYLWQHSQKEDVGGVELRA